MRASGGPSTGQTCGLILIFAVLLQSICVAITYFYFTNELQQNGLQVKTEEQMESHLAVEMEDLPASFLQKLGKFPSSSIFKLRDTYAKSSFACFTRENFFLEDLDPNEKENGDPCWEVKWQLGRLIRKMMAKNRAEEAPSLTRDRISSDAIARDVPGNSGSRVAAHVTSSRNGKKTALVQSSPARYSLGFKIISWQSSMDPSFLYNVVLNNGELIIQQAGLYYIYSQTYFRFRESEEDELNADPDSDSVRNAKQLVQYISKFTDYPDPILLMKSARTSCWSKKAGYGLYSIYQGGVFRLRRNDRIFVSISYEDLVDMDKEASFFGAFLIS